MGTPAQNLRILPGTSSTQTLVVIEEGCQIIKVNDCADSRGEIFNTTASHTWKEIGLFELHFENSLGFTDNGEFGYDTGMTNLSVSVSRFMLILTPNSSRTRLSWQWWPCCQPLSHCWYRRHRVLPGTPCVEPAAYEFHDSK